ncbi:NUDIX domain-containing protein [Gammaproteobacteria bacterium]|nr:NUDIX domain-containing protein [Gammaproteobacteria bacterium]
MNKLNLTPAATVLVLKDSPDGMEVLMVKRSSRPPFGDLFVFPGGKIDESDFNNKIEDFCDDVTDKEASINLGLDSGGLAYWVACIRECFEEVGILLAKKKSGEDLDLDGVDKHKYQKYREMLLNNEIDLYNICLEENLILMPQQIAPFSHWITPEIETRRFDTRFFIAHLPKHQTGEHDGSELIDSVWISPKEALKKSRSGEMPMIMPTIKNLEQCAQFHSGSKLLENQRNLSNEDIPPILPKFFKEDGEWRGLLPGDKGYEDH